MSDEHVYETHAGGGSFTQMIWLDRYGRVSIEFWRDRIRLAAPFTMTRTGAKDLVRALDKALKDTEDWDAEA